MHVAPLLVPLLAVLPAVLGGPVPSCSNTPSDVEGVQELKPNFPMHERRHWPEDWHSGRGIGFMGEDCHWDNNWDTYHHDKLMLLQYAQPGCKGETVHNKAKKFKANTKHNLKHKHHGAHMPTESIQYALPRNNHMDFVDITFYDGGVKHGHCSGNVVLKIDGSKNETMEGNRYACHETPGAKCMAISHTWTDKEHTGTFHKHY